MSSSRFVAPTASKFIKAEKAVSKFIHQNLGVDAFLGKHPKVSRFIAHIPALSKYLLKQPLSPVNGIPQSCPPSPPRPRLRIFHL